jgi:hypothetical protein
LFLQRYPTRKTLHVFHFYHQFSLSSHLSPLSLRHEKASPNIVPISGASRQFDRLMDSFASSVPENGSDSDGADSPDAGAKREAAPPAAVAKLELPARPAESAFEALRSSGVGDVWVPPLTSRGRPSPTQPSQADTGVARRPAVRDSDDDDDSGSSVGENEPDGDIAMLVQHPSLEILESFDTDDLWESRLFWLVPLAPVHGAPSNTAYAHDTHSYCCGRNLIRCRFVWIGSETEEFILEGAELDEWAAEAKASAVKSLPQLAAQQHVACVKQGDEEEWFWNYFVNG